MLLVLIFAYVNLGRDRVETIVNDNPCKSTLLSYVCNAMDIVNYEKLVRSHLYNCLFTRGCFACQFSYYRKDHGPAINTVTN